jgi:hypothetical protein
MSETDRVESIWKIIKDVITSPLLPFLFAFVGGAVVLCPQSLSVTLGFDILFPWRSLITLASSLCVGILIAHGVKRLAMDFGWIYTNAILSIKETIAYRHRCKLLKHLTPPQKKMLKELMGPSDASVYFLQADASLLEAWYVIAQASSVCVMWTNGPACPYFIQPWARRYLEKHPELLS